MSRTHAQSQPYKVAEIQERRAARAEERLGTMRRNLQRALSDAAGLRLERDEATALVTRHAERIEDLELELEHEERQHKTCSQGWQREASAHRQLEALPLWRIAARRMRAWARGSYR